MSLHRCTDHDCPHLGQRTNKGCLCHKTDEQVLREQRDELLAALKAILAAETFSLHVGYDSGAGGGNFVYADVVRLDDEAFDTARAAIARAEQVSA